MYPLRNVDARRVCQKKTGNRGCARREKGSTGDPPRLHLGGNHGAFQPFLGDIRNRCPCLLPQDNGPNLYGLQKTFRVDINMEISKGATYAIHFRAFKTVNILIFRILLKRVSPQPNIKTSSPARERVFALVKAASEFPMTAVVKL